MQRQCSRPELEKCSMLFMKELRDFCNSKVEQLIKARREVGLEGPQEPTDVELRKGWLDEVVKLTPRRIELFIDQVATRHTRKMCEPGTPCGVIAAQSLAEPTTQMTLKSFHFAGVAGVNVTQGVPRILEIMNAVRNISTPQVTAKLINSNDLTVARIVKGRMERTYLGDILWRITEVYEPGQCFLRLCVSSELISKLQLAITVETIRDAIFACPRSMGLAFQAKHIVIHSRAALDVFPFDQAPKKLLHNLEFIKTTLPRVVVHGIRSAKRAIIHDASKDKMKHDYQIIVETDDLRSAMNTPGVDGRNTQCNHVIAVERTLGIEAARKKIIMEICTVMDNYGLAIDRRHVMLLADTMTTRGKVLATTMQGVQKGRDSVLMLASYERASEHIFNAATHQRSDRYMGVSESIILGLPPKVGTGTFRLLRDTQPPMGVPVVPSGQPIKSMKRTFFQQWGVSNIQLSKGN